MDMKLKILFVNKFLYPKGGSESYLFSLAGYMKSRGHEVGYFGMEHESNIVADNINFYVKNMEFQGMALNKILYPFKIIYSSEARKKIGEMINAIKPDIVHLNNYNFQLTPSILYEIKKYDIPTVMTLHDFQLVCPNHMLYREHVKQICEECKGRKYSNCFKNKCIHNSRIKSTLGSLEALVYYKLRTYEKYIDYYIAPSRFLKDKVVEFGESEDKIKIIHNFVSTELIRHKSPNNKKEKYILYFGRLSIQKGIHTLIEACRRLPDIKFVVAGAGELTEQIRDVGNIEYVGYKNGEELKELIRNALFSVCPSEWYENCPMSVLESEMYGTPVIGANIGGIPELIEDGVDGLLFKPGDAGELAGKISYLYSDEATLEKFSRLCEEKVKRIFSLEEYYKKLMEIYGMAIEKHERNGEIVC